MTDCIPGMAVSFTADILHSIINSSHVPWVSAMCALVCVGAFVALCVCMINLALHDARTRLIRRRSLIWCALIWSVLMGSACLGSCMMVHQVKPDACVWEGMVYLAVTSLFWAGITHLYIRGVTWVAVRIHTMFCCRPFLQITDSKSLHRQLPLSEQALLGTGDLWLFTVCALYLHEWVIAQMLCALISAIIMQGKAALMTCLNRTAEQSVLCIRSRFFEPFAFAPHIVAAFLLVIGVVLVL